MQSRPMGIRLWSERVDYVTIEAMMNMKGLTKYFGSLLALDHVDLDIAPGSVTALIGPSGSGKSTLLRCMNLLEIPDGGSISLSARVLNFQPHQRPHRNDVQFLRSHTGMVFQNFQLFPHLDALGNVSLGLRTVRKMPSHEARERAKLAMERVGLSGKLHAFPGQLSGGQQQRVAIARSLAMEPDIILCDEPTSALDPELAVEVIEVLANLAQEGTTMVMATHDLRLARQVSQRVLFLDHGRVVESGNPAEVFGSPRNERTKSFLSSLQG